MLKINPCFSKLKQGSILLKQGFNKLKLDSIF